jgi:pilus assembly protein Flp/PilA
MLQVIRTFIEYYARYIVNDERGATAIEYGLIAALIALAIIAGATAAGDQLDSLFTKVSEQLKSAIEASAS